MYMEKFLKGMTVLLWIFSIGLPLKKISKQKRTKNFSPDSFGFRLTFRMPQSAKSSLSKTSKGMLKHKRELRSFKHLLRISKILFEKNSMKQLTGRVVLSGEEDRFI